ncbi:hypothetical protein BST28_16600 [Mycolicibacter kumamotonensis]|uniref:Membrane protein n=2 Tax=Mycolicibacter kumamotonensis TaxID=354243 RepID=A0A1B8SJD2_9MYCO|nr:membrane protein [Mycolicibacter kumamotonensis]ORA77852.1 hypothetical protein BST28_16600 [Mycolicibacter kumamotonensis]
MTARSGHWSTPAGQPPQRIASADRPIGRWGARRMSRRFAEVGVQIPAARLREMTAGAPPGSAESIDYMFALAATAMQREQRLARAQRNRRRLVHVLIVGGLMLAALNLLICMGYLFISLALHEPVM